MTDSKKPKPPSRVTAGKVFDLVILILSPITLLGLGGFILGVYGIFEFDLPIYSPLIGLGVGVVLGFIARVLLFMDS